MSRADAVRSALLPVLVLALAAPVAARPLEVTSATPFPTWRDPLVLIVRGESETPCGAGAVRLHSPKIDLDTHTVDVELREPCALGEEPPSGAPFEVQMDVGRVPDGPWRIRIFDDLDGDFEVHEVTVYDVGQLDLDLPALLLAGQPVPLRVSGVAECAASHASARVDVTPGLIEVVAGSVCFPITNPPGGDFSRDIEIPPMPPGDYVLRGFTTGGYPSDAVQESTVRVWDPELCVPSETRLCLQGGRFRISGEWRDFDGKAGLVRSAPLTGDDTTGLLWFFSPHNAELTIKLLNGCGLNEHWWVFLSSASTVRYQIEITDMVTGATRRYENPLGAFPRLVADVDALPCGAGV